MVDHRAIVSNCFDRLLSARTSYLRSHRRRWGKPATLSESSGSVPPRHCLRFHTHPSPKKSLVHEQVVSIRPADRVIAVGRAVTSDNSSAFRRNESPQPPVVAPRLYADGECQLSSPYGQGMANSVCQCQIYTHSTSGCREPIWS